MNNKNNELYFSAATKSAVMTLAGAAGAICGPAAVVCGASFTAGTLGAWDGVDSAVNGEERGIIKGFADIHRGDATVGEAFDTIATVGLTAAGGGAEGSVLSKTLGKKVASRGRLLDETSKSVRTGSKTALLDDVDNLCRSKYHIIKERYSQTLGNI
jgi:hypothetical protein